MKKQGKKWMLVVLALLAVVTVTLPLVGCKNDTVAEQTGGNAEQPATPGTGDGTGSGDGNQGTGDGTGSGSGNQGTGDGNQGTGGGTGSGDPEQPETYTVSFKTNGGGFIDSQPIVSGQTVTKPTDPTLEDNVFDGWYSDAKFSKPYDFTTPVTGSFTLYAKWVKRIEVTANSVSYVIAGLTGDGSYILVVTGELNDLSAIKAALNEKPTAKVNLDLSKVSGLTEIGPEAFEGCSGLTSISIPEGVEIIGGDAFYECRGLTSISIPSSVEIIGGDAFFGCKGLTSIDLSKATGLTTIGAGAFEGCRGLTSIDLSKATGLTTIGNHAFGSCRGATVKVEAENPPTLGSGVFEDVSKILVPSGVVNNYKSAEGWSDYEGKIEAIPEPTS